MTPHLCNFDAEDSSIKRARNTDDRASQQALSSTTLFLFPTTGPLVSCERLFAFDRKFVLRCLGAAPIAQCKATLSQTNVDVVGEDSRTRLNLSLWYRLACPRHEEELRLLVFKAAAALPL